jgi:hypothetical protein
MRNFGQFCRKCIVISVLALTLACSALAGDIPFPGVTASAPTNGEMQFPGATVDTVTDTALILLQGASLLF